MDVWLVDDDDDDGETALTCVGHYTRETDAHSERKQLVTQEYLTYVEALRTHRAIDATNAHKGPPTTELSDYLDANDIGAVSDATLRSEGETIDALCYEHVGVPRAWTDERSISLATSPTSRHRRSPSTDES